MECLTVGLRTVTDLYIGVFVHPGRTRTKSLHGYQASYRDEEYEQEVLELGLTVSASCQLPLAHGLAD